VETCVLLHSWHTETEVPPVSVENVSTVHSVQTVWPESPAAKVPPAQSWHVVRPLAAMVVEYFPATQLMHTLAVAAIAAECCPATQLTQSALPALFL